MGGERIVAYCGIVCNKCPAYIATQKNDDNMRRDIAKRWSEMYGSEIKPEYVNCDGCNIESERRIDFTNQCQIRLCGMAKDIPNCAFCDDYPCDKLDEIFKSNPTSKNTLDEIRDR